MDDGYLTGTRLMTVLGQGAKAETFAYGTLGPLEAIEGFWEQYKQMGRCVVDPEHKIAFIGDEDRWSVEGDSRSCSWCGQVHQKLVTREIGRAHSELQSLMRISYAVFCLKKKKMKTQQTNINITKHN